DPDRGTWLPSAGLPAGLATSANLGPAHRDRAGRNPRIGRSRDRATAGGRGGLVMRAARLHGPRDLRVEAVAPPPPGAGGVLLEVAAAGICGTDFRIWTGERPVRYPLIPGHEFVGKVVAVGTGVERVGVGQRVAIEPNWGCGDCDLCQVGRGNLCLRRT